MHISDGKAHEVIMNRGFLDFERLFRFHEAGSFFVTRDKSKPPGPTPLLASGRSHDWLDL